MTDDAPRFLREHDAEQTIDWALQRVLTDAYNYIREDRDSLEEACCPDGASDAAALLRRIEPFLRPLLDDAP